MRRSRDERGAVAILVTVLSVALFGVAALAVDLGHAWATKRVVQRQADVAALAAGSLLPATSGNRSAIAEAVAARLNANLVPGQPAATATGLTDLDPDNGEITFTRVDGTACVEDCPVMSVLPPSAHVPFGFAGIFGHSGTDVQQRATVQVQRMLPHRDDILPFWLPSGCAYGPAMADAPAGASLTPPTTTDPTGTASPSPTSPAPSGSSSSSPATTPTSSTSTGTHLVSAPPYQQPVNSTVQVSGVVVDGVPPQVDRASIRFTSPDGTVYVDYAAQPVRGVDPLEVPPFLVGPEVTGTPGDWQVHALVQQRGTAQVSASANAATFAVLAAGEPSVVTGPSPSATSSPTTTASAMSAPVGCVGHSRGNFGQITSPRRDVSGRDATLALNIASGLDHQLVPYVFDEGMDPTKECVSPQGSVLPGALLDDVPEDGRNCILADPGNNGSVLMRGFVTGYDGVPGRIAASRAPTTCPSRPSLVIAGVSLNNDTLACFLRPGATLDDLAQPEGAGPDLLDPNVVHSPRLVWLPVVYAVDRAQKRFQPIREFVPAFITSETQLSGPSDTNGLTVAGGSISSLQLFVFHPAALPVDPRAPSVDHDGTGPAIVRLVG